MIVVNKKIITLKLRLLDIYGIREIYTQKRKEKIIFKPIKK
jgi:hypothetical protein